MGNENTEFNVIGSVTENLRKISQQMGASRRSNSEYLQYINFTRIVFKIQDFTKTLSSTTKYLFIGFG